MTRFAAGALAATLLYLAVAFLSGAGARWRRSRAWLEAAERFREAEEAVAG